MFESLMDWDVFDVSDEDEDLDVLLLFLFDFFDLVRSVFTPFIESISLRDLYLVGFFATVFNAGTLKETVGELLYLLERLFLFFFSLLRT